MKIIISTLPETLVNISKCYKEGINSDNENMNYMLIAPKNVDSITVKELQVALKNALKKIYEDNITRFKSNCKNQSSETYILD